LEHTSITRKWILKKEGGMSGMNLLVSGQGPVVGIYVHNNAPWGSIKCGEFVYRLHKY
jgi:hypothetical protein